MPAAQVGSQVGWRRGLSRYPLFAAAMAAVAAVIAASHDPLFGVAVAMLAGAIGAIFHWKTGLSWLLCGLLSVSVFLWRDGTRARQEHQLSQLEGASPVKASAVLLADAQAIGNRWSAPARLTSSLHSGAKVWWEGAGAAPVADAEVSATVGFLTLRAPLNPGEFDRAAWLRLQDVAAICRSTGADDLAHVGPIARLGAALRQGFRNRVVAGLDGDSIAAKVILAVVIGERPRDADAIIADFRNSGTLHVFSVSGLHVAMVAGMCWFVLARIGIARKFAIPALLPLVFGYAWITGNSDPALRSAWMTAVFLGAFAFRRKPNLLNALGAVWLVGMLLDGRMIFKPGVQLSYGVVAAIAIGTAWASRVFSWMARPDPMLAEPMMDAIPRHWLRLRRHLAGSLSVSLAAAIGSSPLILFHFGLVTPVSVIASLVLMPIVFFILAAALLSAVLGSWIPLASMGINQVNAHAASFCAASAGWFSNLPAAHFQMRRPSQTKLTVFSLDQGAGAACFSGADGSAVLIDCGDPAGFRHRIAPALRDLGIVPDSVVVTHPDGRHLGGGSLVWNAFPIRQALLPVERARSPTYRTWLEQAPVRRLHMNRLAPGARLPLPDGATLEVLHLPDPSAVNALADDRVAILRLHWRGWRILITSDAGMDAEIELLESRRDIAADVIVAGRHATASCLADRFIAAVAPKAIIATNADFPEGERLPDEDVAFWESLGIAVFDLTKTGAVTLTIDESGQFLIDGFLPASPPRVLRR
jgi:ComEC/Rec2-related protein